MIRTTLLTITACLIAACGKPPARLDADVIVVGAGIAGIATALEASAAGARVVVVEWSSVPGGHAVEAGGFTLVDTPLQQKKGHSDSPDLAYRELMAWGEDANPEWVRQFVELSRTDVHDWLTDMGVSFSILLPTPEGSVPRFHFAGGTAVNAVVPMLREAIGRNSIRWSMNTRVTDIRLADDGTYRVTATNMRSGAGMVIDAAAVVLATGGFQGNLERVRQHWPGELDEPERILMGAGHFAIGDGIELGTSIGAGVTRLTDQVTFVDGMPNPRDPVRGFLVQNPAAIRVDLSGRRFVDESAVSKVMQTAVLSLDDQTHWMVFDSNALRQLRVRGAEWLNRETIVNEILDNPAVFAKANSVTGLADEMSVPPATLNASIDGWLGAGDGRAFGKPPYYAVQLWPMTRKSMGGLKIDLEARALDSGGQPVPGLFAAGELTGVAGINGSYGGSGTFLAPSVLTGRFAGRGAAAHAAASGAIASGFDTATDTGKTSSVRIDAAGLAEMLKIERDGYWHFERAHRVVVERDYECSRCHAEGWNTVPATTRADRLTQLGSCTSCH